MLEPNFEFSRACRPLKKSILFWSGLILLIITTFLNSAFAYDFRENEYEEIRDISLTILEKYPPNEYFYLGIGQSPTPIVAFLSSIDPKIAGSIPLSSLRFQSTSQLDPNSNLCHHFDRFMPTAETLAGRKILLIDYVHRGESLVKAWTYFLEYTQLRKRTTKFKAMALGPRKSIMAAKFRALKKGRLLDSITLSSSSIIEERLQRSGYDNYSEYGTHMPSEDTKIHDFRPRKEYREFKEAFQEKIDSDLSIRNTRQLVNTSTSQFTIGCLKQTTRLLK